MRPDTSPERIDGTGRDFRVVLLGFLLLERPPLLFVRNRQVFQVAKRTNALQYSSEMAQSFVVGILYSDMECMWLEGNRKFQTPLMAYDLSKFWRQAEKSRKFVISRLPT